MKKGIVYFEGKHTQSEQIVRGEVVAANEDEAKKNYYVEVLNLLVLLK